MIRKYYPHNSVLFCTSRTEEGLPLVCSHNMNLIVEGILAKATNDYQIEVNHSLFMANHFHMIVTVINPDDVREFFRYVKGEIAHAVNRLLGRRKRTLWINGYDSPIVLDEDKLKNLISYLYLNPLKANLVSTLSEYPGVSSWKMLKKKQRHKDCTKLPRDKIRKLHNPALSVSEQKELVKTYKVEGKVYKLAYKPLSCFYAINPDSKITLDSLIEFVERQEKSLIRSGDKTEVLGITKLRRQSMQKAYTSKKHSPKMICLSTDKELRKRVIGYFKYLCSVAKKVYKKWKTGDLSAKIPAGMYAPRLPLLVSALE